jgi:hypothetical protein
MGHYIGVKDTLHIFYGSPKGFSPENSQAYLAGYSPIHTAVADFNRDGNLDLIATAYSSTTARVLPAQLFWGNGKSIDLDHPVNLPAEISEAVLLGQPSGRAALARVPGAWRAAVYRDSHNR